MSYPKTVPFFILALIFIQCKNHNSFENVLKAPDDGWRSEVIKFPLEFASSIKYSGLEHISFAPGWGNKDTKDYFSYVFLWDILEDPKLSTSTLESEMEDYFDGLMSMVSKMNLKIFKKIPKSKAFFEKVNDSVYIGKILTYDAFTTQDKISLNIIVNYKYCDLQEKYLVLFNISPQPPDQPIWKKLKKVTIDMDCDIDSH